MGCGCNKGGKRSVASKKSTVVHNLTAKDNITTPKTPAELRAVQKKQAVTTNNLSKERRIAEKKRRDDIMMKKFGKI